jgi:hypothetical protein
MKSSSSTAVSSKSNKLHPGNRPPSSHLTKNQFHKGNPVVERIGVSELRDLDHALSDLDDRPIGLLRLCMQNVRKEIDGDDDESQATMLVGADGR